MAIAEVVPKKEGDTRTATVANINSNENKYGKISGSTTKRNYFDLKRFTFKIPDGFSNDDIIIFIDLCKVHIQDLKNIAEDKLKWKNIAKSGAAKSSNPAVFTGNICQELGQRIYDYIKNYEVELKKNKLFITLTADVQEILPYLNSSVDSKKMKSDEAIGNLNEQGKEVDLASAVKQNLDLFKQVKPSGFSYVWSQISKKVKIDVKKHYEHVKSKIISEVESETDPILKKDKFLDLTRRYDCIEFYDHILPRSSKVSNYVSDFGQVENTDVDSQEDASDGNSEKKMRKRKAKIDLPEPPVAEEVPADIQPPVVFSAKNNNKEEKDKRTEDNPKVEKNKEYLKTELIPRNKRGRRKSTTEKLDSDEEPDSTQEKPPEGLKDNENTQEIHETVCEKSEESEDKEEVEIIEETEEKIIDVDNDEDIPDSSAPPIKTGKRKKSREAFVTGWPNEDVVLFVNMCVENVASLKEGGYLKWKEVTESCQKLSSNPYCFTKENCATLAHALLKKFKKYENDMDLPSLVALKKLYESASQVLPYFEPECNPGYQDIEEVEKSKDPIELNAENAEIAPPEKKKRGRPRKIIKDNRKREKIMPTKIIHRRNHKPEEILEEPIQKEMLSVSFNPIVLCERIPARKVPRKPRKKKTEEMETLEDTEIPNELDSIKPKSIIKKSPVKKMKKTQKIDKPDEFQTPPHHVRIQQEYNNRLFRNEQTPRIDYRRQLPGTSRMDAEEYIQPKRKFHHDFESKRKYPKTPLNEELKRKNSRFMRPFGLDSPGGSKDDFHPMNRIPQDIFKESSHKFDYRRPGTSRMDIPDPRRYEELRRMEIEKEYSRQMKQLRLEMHTRSNSEMEVVDLVDDALPPQVQPSSRMIVNRRHDDTDVPKWFQQFATYYRQHDEWKFHQIMNLQQTHLSLEERKISVLNDLVTKLDRMIEH